MTRHICHGMIVITGFVMLMLPACKEAPTVFPLDAIISAISNPPGYYYPLILNVSPVNGSADVAVNTKYSVVFSSAINPATLTAATVLVHTGPPSPGRYRSYF